MIERLLQRSAGFYADRVGGKIVSDALDFSNAYGGLMTNGFIKGIGFLAIIISGVLILLATSWVLGFSILVLLFILTVWTIHNSKQRKGYRTIRLRTSKELTSHLSDSLVNAITVKTFAREYEEIKTSQALSNKLRDQRDSDWTRTVADENRRVSLVVVLQILLVFMLIKLVNDDPAILSTGIFAFTYTITLLGRFFEINSLVRQVDEAILNASPMAEILLQPIEIIDAHDAKNLEVSDGKVDIRNMHFAYPGSKNGDKVFDDFSLHIEPGEKIGLVGHSGGGKSTLTRLLLRFDDVSSGSITIDNQDIKSVTQTSLRRAISYVPQEPLLFHRSVLENIRYGNPTASVKEVEHAAKLASAFEFIKKLPSGLETLVGERGVKLSGGQRQRIAIARAILKNSPILVLDEATSALDSESESAIQTALGELMKHRTSIVIAHRLSTVQRMDRIVVLDEGKVVEQGSHKELLAENGIYAKLWAHQSGGFIEE